MQWKVKLLARTGIERETCQNINQQILNCVKVSIRKWIFVHKNDKLCGERGGKKIFKVGTPFIYTFLQVFNNVQIVWVIL